MNIGSHKIAGRFALWLPGIHLSVHLLPGNPIDWLSASTPSQAKTETAISEERRADQEEDQPGVAPVGGKRTKEMWAPGSRYNSGGGPPAWAECLGRSHKSSDAYYFPGNKTTAATKKVMLH